MILLALAALFLPLSHLLISSTPLRALLVSLLGNRRYSLAYSVLALGAFAWLTLAYRAAPAAVCIQRTVRTATRGNW